MEITASPSLGNNSSYTVFILLYLKNEELGSEIEELNASLAKAREATHKAHVQKFKVRTSNLLGFPPFLLLLSL